MALNPENKAAASAPSNKAATSAPSNKAVASAPPLPWLGPIYAASLVLIFLGERVTTTDTFRLALSGLGVAGALATTALRFVWTARVQNEGRAAERTLALLSLGGLVAVAIYFATTTETGRSLLGIAQASPAARLRIDGAATVIWIGLLAISALPLLFGELALAPMRRAPQPEVRRVRAAIAAGLAVAFAVVYIALFTFTAGELELKADYSYFRTSRPSESTRNIGATVTEPIKVVAFFPQLNDVGTEVDGYLRELSAAAPNIKVESYDRLMVPALAKDAKVTQDGVLVLTRGAARETISIGADMKTAATKLKSLDGDFQKALIKVLREARIAYLTLGHGELNEARQHGTEEDEGRSAKSFRKLLESQNYTIKELGLTQGLGTEIPADATLVAVLGPSKPLLPEEVAALKKYADRGGHLLLALDPEAKVELGPLAEIAGLTWQKAILANDKTYLRRRFNASDKTIIATNRFSSHASVSTLSRNSFRAALILPGASSLDKREGADQQIDFAIKSLADTFNDESGDFELTAPNEKRSSYNIAAAVSKRLPAPADSKSKDALEMRAFVVADADALSDATFGNESNALFAVDVIRWLGGEESFSGSISSTEDVRIEHTKQKDVLWFYTTIIGAPALVLGLGLVATRRRKGAARGPAKEKKG